MLKELRVNNFAIIDELKVSFKGGLNVLSGETGAGKSIIIGALGLVLGERAYSEMIKTGRDSATVEATFDLPEGLGAGTPGYDGKGKLTIKRIISKGGKSKAYLNGNAVNVQAISELGKCLVDVHGQHEHQSLLSTDNQTLLLDRYGGLVPERDKVASLYGQASSIQRKLDALKHNTKDRQQRMDLLKFQVTEIEEAALEPGEDTRLSEEFDILSNLGKLRELMEHSYEQLYSSEGAAVERASSALTGLSEAADIDNELSGALDSLSQAKALLEDAALTVRDLKDKYEMDPARLDHVQERIEYISRLKKKYGETIEDILKYANDSAEELDALDGAEENAEGLVKEYDQKEKELRKAASALSAKRKKTALKLEDSVIGELKGLELDSASFKVSFEEAEITASGMDSMEFLFSANKGEVVKPLGRVASGGELSRIMLAMKTVLREVDGIPVLVFDEVDAGIGGKTAGSVATRLHQAAGKRQVLCITHLPQIASRGGTHLLIEKSAAGNGTNVSVRELSGSERQEEIARMLSGSVTEASLKHARELLSSK
ncbi:DNA repair protein RecN [Nitrospirota bacterium]